MARRAILLVLDGVGAGELPDANVYGDGGSHTLGNIARMVPLRIPTLTRLGLGAAVPMAGVEAPPAPQAAWGRMAERSAGKDSVTGHWELMGLVLDGPFPTFPGGFPPALIEAFEARIGRRVLGNVVASGTAIINTLGDEHCRTGRPIVYTSADSVFQIAVHEGVVPLEDLYAWCRAAYELAVDGLGVGRVIARPFVGTTGAYTRTSNRHDYAMPPTGVTLLDRLHGAGIPVTTIGKVADLFAGRGVARAIPTSSDEDGMRQTVSVLEAGTRGLVFVNLVDFDTQFGHRNDVAGFASNLERFDGWLPAVLDRLDEDDLLIVTADHGNDPTTPSTDHSREHVPLLVTAPWMTAPGPLGVRDSFADVGQTLAAWFGVPALAGGVSFLDGLRERG
jgi:phosphopentomutase